MGTTANELEHEMDENNMKDGKERRWSLLPSLPLWMIMERLNLAENVFLAAVWKEWNLVSGSYPINAQQKCVAPYFMHQLPESTICVFVNMSTMKENIYLHLPDFHEGTTLMFARRGWLLLHKCLDNGPGNPSLYIVVLLHVQTNARIMMQAPEEEEAKKFVASFTSSDDGTPTLVIFAKCDGTNIILYAAETSDGKWTKHSYGNGGTTSIRSSIVFQKKVYCLVRVGDLLIFDMSKPEWKEVTGDTKPCWMIGSEEDGILKVETDRGRKSFAFFKLNDSQTGWEELSERDTAGRNWFVSSIIGAKNNHYTVTEAAGTEKVYRLNTYVMCAPEVKLGTNISVHDLIDGTEKFYEVKGHGIGQWVDLGQIVKAPPSCLGYLPSAES